MSIQRMSQNSLAEFIGKICASAQEIQGSIHVAAWNSLDHTRVHGDYSNALRLLNSLPNGTRVKSLAYWFNKMSSGKFRPLQNSKTKVYECEKLGTERTDAHFLMAEAETTNFADLTSEKDPTPVTLESFIRNLRRTATNDGKFEGTEIYKVAPEARAVALSLVQFIDKAQAAKVVEEVKAA